MMEEISKKRRYNTEQSPDFSADTDHKSTNEFNVDEFALDLSSDCILIFQLTEQISSPQQSSQQKPTIQLQRVNKAFSTLTGFRKEEIVRRFNKTKNNNNRNHLRSTKNNHQNEEEDSKSNNTKTTTNSTSTSSSNKNIDSMFTSPEEEIAFFQHLEESAFLNKTLKKLFDIKYNNCSEGQGTEGGESSSTQYHLTSHKRRTMDDYFHYTHLTAEIAFIPSNQTTSCSSEEIVNYYVGCVISTPFDRVQKSVIGESTTDNDENNNNNHNPKNDNSNSNSNTEREIQGKDAMSWEDRLYYLELFNSVANCMFSVSEYSYEKQDLVRTFASDQVCRCFKRPFPGNTKFLSSSFISVG